MMIVMMVSVSVLVILSALFILSVEEALASLDLSSIDEMTRDFTENLNSEIEEFVSETVNKTRSAVNSSTAILSNGSNLSSSQIIVSNNQDVLANATGGALILNQVKSNNGQCSSNVIGGPGGDTLTSNGACNDQLTGGLGADKFICGQGTDTVRDYSPAEGDTIIDRQSCETVL